MPRGDDARRFLARVHSWPASDADAGLVNVHSTWPSKDPKKPNFFTGKAFRDVDAAMGYVKWLQGQADARDVYHCTSLQAQTTTNRNGKVVALRNIHNTLTSKVLFLDIDVKAPPKGYATRNEALLALAAFCKNWKLPLPTAIVGSGGGLHCYWVSDRPMAHAEWQPLAEKLRAAGVHSGLRFDGQCTVDMVRILRIPETGNWKTNPPLKVELLRLAPTDFNFDTQIQPALDAVPPLALVKASVTAPVTPAFDPKLFVKRPLPAIYAGITPGEAQAGIEFEAPPLDVKAVLKGCGFLRETLRSGGVGRDQPLWNLSTLAATFMGDKGRKIAHAMSDKHVGYNTIDTDSLFDRKEAEKRSKDMGWPSCGAIEQAGSKDCALCPHRGKIKSPLNLGIGSSQPKSAQTVNKSNEPNFNPVVALRALRDQGAGLNALLAAMNETYAAVKYGGQIVVASIVGKDLHFMKLPDFHNMLANLFVYEEKKDAAGEIVKRRINLSRHWFSWKDRRQYLARGVVFEPGGPLEIPNDMLNLWRGFGIAPAPGDWSLMRTHILAVMCSGQQADFDYFVHWMAYAVQHPDEPVGVAIALLGGQGAGKGVVARTFGSFYGKHFTHITHSDHLTGHFNASLGTSCAVFLDEAVWAGDKKGEGVLKALITEPTFQMEAKFRDPIMVDNRLRIIVASNNEWAVPAGIGDRRWFVLKVANTYAGTTHQAYWDALYGETKNGGAAAMLHDLLAMDLSGFDLRAVPHTAAKAQQQVLSLRGTMAWLHHILQDGAIGGDSWGQSGLTISTDDAYGRYRDFSKERHEWQPDVKSIWSKKIHDVLHPTETRPTVAGDRVRTFVFAPLGACRQLFEQHVGAPTIVWEVDPSTATPAVVQAPDLQPGVPRALDQLARHDGPAGFEALLNAGQARGC